MQEVVQAGRLVVPQRELTPGECLIHGGYPVEALPFIEADLKRQPDRSGHWNNYGMCQKFIGNYDEAIESFRKAIELGPNILMPHHNLGMCYEETGRFEEATREYSHVCAWSQDENCMYALACCLLRERKFDQALQFWERARLAKNSAVIVPNLKVWRGDSLAGQKILVIREGGFGDFFWLMRYLKPLKDMGAHVTYMVPKSMLSLLDGHPWIDVAMLDSTQFLVQDYDYQIPLWSLPWELRKIGQAQVPWSPGPYIDVDSGARSRRGLRVGMAPYAGENLSIHRKMRSIQPELVERFRDIPVSWTWLCGEAAPEWCAASIKQGCDWLETAKVIAELDAVVCVDSSVMHLAGALGVPTLVALPKGSDWKWFYDEDKSCWYDKMRLYRNQDAVSFKPVVDNIIRDLKSRFSESTQREVLCEART